MSRFKVPQPEEAPEESLPMLAHIAQQLGFVPQSYRLLSISPAVLWGFAALESHLSKTLDLKTRNGIALTVSQLNGSRYCLSAHAHRASELANMDPEEITLNRAGTSHDPKRAAALAFARRVVERRGKVTNAELAAVRSAGYRDEQILEIVALSVQVLFTNFMNNVAQSDLDFPAVDVIR